ncbi:hypothetical protein BD779DRAFT_1672162 [Infundibulicybe gibba]|nr:hypothetical protein BD779DRAFT_1672162 [Infundibulicybe gibba]
MSPDGIPNKLMFISSLILLLSGVMQLSAAWLRHKTQTKTLKVHAAGGTRAGVVDKYSWVGNDFPNALPINLDSVAMTIENSRHYALNAPNSDAEYQSLYPGELGFLRLGPHHRFFGIAMYHQLHCLNSLRKAIIHGGEGHGHGERGAGEKREQVPHVHHCLNYLRQTILCNADLTLEPEIVLGSQDVGEGLGVTHVCKDWSALHHFIDRNYEEWKNVSAT